jgi:uncharacterized Zn-binding protein involved in type VI secretion
VGGPILPPCAMTVIIGGLPAARITDMATCVGPPDVIVKGSPTVLIEYLPAARMLDNCAHGGMIVLGCFTVIIGDFGSGGGGGGGGASAPSAIQAPAMMAGAPIPGAPQVPLPPDSKSPRQAAQEILAKAAQAEPTVTAALKSVEQDVGGQLTGLDYRMKSEDSLTRKIADRSKHESIENITSDINDALRYTLVVDENSYTQSVNTTIAKLESQGFKKLKVKRSWGKGTPYKGINSVFETPSGQAFELQFHTPESFHVKNEVTHGLYEKARLASTPVTEKVAIAKEMIRISDSLKTPLGVEQIAQFPPGAKK